MPVKTPKHHKVDMPMKKAAVDKPLLYAALALAVAGFIILSSASMAIAYKEHGSVGYYTLRQLMYGGSIGLIAFVVCLKFPYRYWKKIALPLIIGSFILMALIFVPQLSYTAGGARRWIRLGQFSFQPSEILKLGFIIYLTTWLETRRKEIKSISYGMMPFILMISIIGIFLMMQPDFGTFGIILMTAGIMYFLGGGRIAQMGMMSVFGAAALYVLIQIQPYRLTRFLVFLDPKDTQGSAYHITQALIAIGSGGFWGLGFGRSMQKYNYLPEPMTDSIFAIFAEETGLLGVCALLALFLFFLFRALVIAKRAPDAFGRLLATGMAVSIMVQAFINMAAISGLLPLTGIALPFISWGSTSLVITMAMAGIILNVSTYK